MATCGTSLLRTAGSQNLIPNTQNPNHPESPKSMEITLTTPALLFPAISLLLLAYTNRFLTLATLIRQLHSQYQKNPSGMLVGQIENLRRRVVLIRNMQALGILSLLLCVVCMFLLFANEYVAGWWIFGVSLFLLIVSLALSLQEIIISVRALNIQLSDLESMEQQRLAHNQKSTATTSEMHNGY